ncbi:MAG TPA: single-stranded-DNA-specific exonuclease RecJ [Patescibacteria group bacterium]|jgi:single-stranded-DNA-specific exonuclease|nr:single-stranded-DNA-specific exonuclease RecJ [Patescibacteria group bacterium]
MRKEWQIQPAVPKDILEQFPELRSLVLQLLYNRGIDTLDRVEWFLNPDYHNLYDPFLFTDMGIAVDRIWEAIENKEKILIYADYDADAVTANAVLQQTFRYLGAEVESYIPDRFAEGYGLNMEAFEKIKEQGVNLVITVDCGTNSVAEAEFCAANEIDLIITDHHEITGATPESFALINPKNPIEVYPDDQITGVGVSYKLAKALLMQAEKVIEQKGIDPEDYQPEWDKWLLDLVAIGTVADCHSLMGENRILVKFGLKVMQKTKWLGLRQLIENAGIDILKDTLDSQTIGFTIAPRINAAGRLEHADVALGLLTATDFAEAITLANRLEDINRRRRDLTNRIVSEAKEQAELLGERKVLLLHNDAWAKGLVGIVAGRIADIYNRPAIVLERGETESTGSARVGTSSFDIVECLKAAQEHLVKFGGHKQAAGLTAKTAELDALYAAILKYADAHPAESGPPTITIDAELGEQDLSLPAYEDILQLEPYGAGNTRPIFAINEARVASFKAVGAAQQHLLLKIILGETSIDCIGFNMAYLAPRLDFGSKISIAGELMVDTWQGIKKLKMRLIDVHLEEAREPDPLPLQKPATDLGAAEPVADEPAASIESNINQEIIK